MDKYLKKFSDMANYGHCIIKEELMISDSDEEIDVEKLDVTIVSTLKNANFSGSQAEIKFNKHKSKETLTSRKSERLRNKNVGADNKKQTTLDSFMKSENFESDNEQSDNSSDPTDNEKSTEAVTTTDDIDALARKVGKSYCKKCRIESLVVRLKSRCSKCQTRFSYICQTCKKTYKNFSYFGYHLKIKHIEVHLTHKCSICDRIYSDRKGLMIHRRIQHNIRQSLQCSKCKKSFSRSVNMVMHEKFCSKGIVSSTNYENSSQTILYKCDKCFYTTRFKKRITSHALEKHTDGFKAECENCPKVFKTQRSLRRHVIHYCNKAKPFECDYCGHKFYRKDQIILHLDQNHMKGYYTNSNSDKKFRDTKTCQNCGLTLGPDQQMKTHMITCKPGLLSVSGPFKKEPRICKYCGETMKRFEHMRYHVERCESAPLALRYTAERAKLPDMDTALTELAILHCVKCKTKEPLNDRVRRCSKCNKLLKFACVSCRKSFADSSHLREHLERVHVRTLKFYRCDKCRCSYNREKNLIAHQRVAHSNKQPTTNYKCKKCGKEYRSKASLRKHTISCIEEPKFYCDKCPYKTHFKNSIIEHIWAKRGTCM